jgi:acetyl esterase/lipase
MKKNESIDRVAIEEGIVVGIGGGRELKADVYLPPAGLANRAGVLLVHGGGWRGGDRTQLRGYGILLGRVGYTCVACEYRLAPDNKWPAQIEDVRTAYDWMLAHTDDLGIDADRIAAEGNSAGAHLSLMLAGTAPGVAACVSIYGPTDLGRRMNISDADRPGRVNAVRELMGQTDGASLAEASPVTYASASFPPTMLLHGNADETVPVEQSFVMYRALIDAGAKAELHIFEGEPHAFDRESGFGRQCASLMTLFLGRHVLAKTPAAVGT